MPSTYAVACGIEIRPLHVERVHELPPQGLVPGGHLLGRELLLGGSGDDLVLDVGNVRNEAHVNAAPLEVPAQRVPYDGDAAVTKVEHT